MLQELSGLRISYREELLKDFCEDEAFMTERRHLLRLRAGLKDQDKHKVGSQVCLNGVYLKDLVVVGAQKNVKYPLRFPQISFGNNVPFFHESKQHKFSIIISYIWRLMWLQLI